MRTIGWPSAIVFLLLSTAPHAVAVTGLPPVECLQELRRARFAEAAGDLEAAHRILERAIESYPAELAPIQNLLALQRRHGASAQERSHVRGLLLQRLADDTRPVPAGSLRLLAGSNDLPPEDAEAILAAADRGLRAAPEDIELLVAAFLLEKRLDRLEDARKRLTRLIELDAGFRFEWEAYELDRELEQWQPALDFVERRLSEEGTDTTLVLARLRLLGKLGRFDEVTLALDELTADAAIESADSEPVYLAGTNEQRDSFAGLMYMLGWDLFDLGMESEAGAMWRRAQAADPERVYARKASLYLLGTEEEQLALDDDLELRWAQETDPRALLDEGTSRLAAGDFEAALGLLKRAAPSFPRLEAAWFNLGLAAFRLEAWEEVDRALKRAAEINPERAEAFLNRGLALVQLERFEDGARALERALALDPSRHQAHYYLATCYRNLGDESAAEAAMARYRAASGG